MEGKKKQLVEFSRNAATERQTEREKGKGEREERERISSYGLRRVWSPRHWNARSDEKNLVEILREKEGFACAGRAETFFISLSFFSCTMQRVGRLPYVCAYQVGR